MSEVMSRKVVHSPGAPQAIGPYSQAISVVGGRMVFLSGQIPLDPTTQQLVGGDAGAQAARVMENLGAVLAAEGLGYGNVVRCTLFLVDLADFGAVNEVYGRYFPGEPPARTTVQVVALPRGARVEIDAIAAG